MTNYAAGAPFDHDAQPLTINAAGPVYEHIAVAITPACGPLVDVIISAIPAGYPSVSPIPPGPIPVTRLTKRPRDFKSPFVYRQEQTPRR